MNKEQQDQNNRGNGGGFAERVSDLLFRWRRIIFISVLAVLVVVVGWGVYSVTASQRSQKTALAVYKLRKAFKDWKEANPESLLTAAKGLENSDEQLDLDEETMRQREETEKALTGLLEKALEENNLLAWGYWIQVLKARHLQENEDFRAALEKLIALNDKTFHKIAKLQLAGLLFSEGKAAEAVALWRNLADVSGPEPAQIIASVYLGNYFARSDRKDEAINYWAKVVSLGNELLQVNSLEDEDSFLGGDNLITGNFRNTLKQWETMAENQLLFLQSDNIQVAADSYDETVEPEEETVPQEETGESLQTLEADAQNFSFTTGTDGVFPGQY